MIVARNGAGLLRHRIMFAQTNQFALPSSAARPVVAGSCPSEGRDSASVHVCRRRMPNGFRTDFKRMIPRKSAKQTDITDSVLHFRVQLSVVGDESPGKPPLPGLEPDGASLQRPAELRFKPAPGGRSRNR
jgi:hypothetical protein